MGAKKELIDEEKLKKDLEELSKAVKSVNLSALNKHDRVNKDFKFWKTQPVPKLDEEVKTLEPIEKDKTIEEISKNPLPLPAEYKWDVLDIDDPDTLKELYTLLSNNYVEDDDNMFRFNYSPEFLHWVLKPPCWNKEWHCGLRVKNTNLLVGFISAVPAKIRLKENVISMVEINFLCVAKVLRSKRMAPVLIKEITRRVNLNGIFQAVYTAGILLPKPVGKASYWHRSLNPKKLIKVKFSQLGRNMTLQRTIKFYKLPEKPKLPGFRKLTEKDIDETLMFLNKYLEKFDLAPIFNKEEFKHYFTPQENIVDSFVVEQNEKIVGFTSFFTLPSFVMNDPIYKDIKAAYSFYNVPSETVNIKDLATDALIMASSLNYDVFNALDLMDNKQFLQDLKFGIGDGNLHYYLFNYKCPTIESDKIALILQ